MTKPTDFISTTDYATLKNDASTTLTVVVPGSASMPMNTVNNYTTTATIGQAGSSIRGRGNSSRNATIWYVANQVSFQRTGTLSGSPTPYTLTAVVYRTAPDTLTLLATIFNPYAGTLTTQSGSETITFEVSTFLSPFA